MGQDANMIVDASIALKHALRRGDFELDVDVQIPATGITGLFGESGDRKSVV